MLKELNQLVQLDRIYGVGLDKTIFLNYNSKTPARFHIQLVDSYRSVISHGQTNS